MKSKAKLISILCAVFLAVAAVITGLCFFFFGNKGVSDVPEVVSVFRVDDDVVVSTTFRPDASYAFLIEQKAEDDNFVVIKTERSATNNIHLSKVEGFALSAGTTYRFSACYASETALGKFCEGLVWQNQGRLPEVTNLKVTGNVVSWDEIDGADSYTLAIYTSGGQYVLRSTCTQPSFDVGQLGLDAGRYKIYVMANAQSHSSSGGDGIFVDLKFQNVISVARKTSYGIFVTCNGRADAFEIYADGNLVATVKGTLREGSKYNFEIRDILQFVEQAQTIQIKSLENGFLLESELVTVSATN